MNFTAIRDEVLARCNLTSSDASVRVGQAVNRHYRRITSTLGMETTRVVTRDLPMTVGVRTVTIGQIEKIERVFDITTTTRPLTEISLHQMRVLTPGSGEPGAWAVQNVTAQTVTILLDTTPSFAWALRVDGWTTLTDLTGTDEPVFPASFHDVLTWFVLSEELLRKEKTQLAAAYEGKAEALLNDLRFHLADTHTRDLQQASHAGGPGSGQGGAAGSGGGGPSGASHLINLPPNSLVGRGKLRGPGISETIMLGPGVVLTGDDGTTLDTVFQPIVTTWTPMLTGTGGASDQVYSTQNGLIIRIGSLVFCSGRLTLAQRGTIAGTVQIANFPVANNPLAHVLGGVAFMGGLLTPVASFAIRLDGGGTTATLLYLPPGGATSWFGMLQTDFNATGLDFMFSVTYSV